jgi:hypothetical protein
MAKIDFPTATTEQLLQLVEYHGGKAADRAEFYKGKSTAIYREQAATYAQEWAELYARLAEQLQLLRSYELAGLTGPLTIDQRLALRPEL